MPRSSDRTKVERGLYRSGRTYLACATPPSQRQARWKALGEVGIMEARRLRDEFRAEVAGDRDLPSAAVARVTFAEAAADWLERAERLVTVGELAHRTYDAYESASRLHLVPYFGQRRLRSIGPDQLAEWHATQRAAGAATWSVKGRWSALRGILGYAARRRLIDANPADLLERRERPRAGESRKRFLTEDEMRRLLAAARERYRPLFALCLFSGLRLSEALGLVWADVDFDHAVIRVRLQRSRDGKRARIKTPAAVRDVVLMGELAQLLRKAKMASHFKRPQDPVFATGNRTSLSQRNATRAFEKSIDRAKLSDMTFHALRHTFASLLIAQGRDPVFVADQLGHTSPKTTLGVYSHLFRAAREALAARAQLDAEYGALLREASSREQATAEDDGR